ncbi:hypothetical protein RHMOL_Rhmol06G0046500 [Rhododendron molle]|uniref:Uncharacterized protein n=1 Tax=Rhododendron molle TaxID=49168 RepID=A0ACC0NA76_RHOML|nr:hypothetical protein RHMOL_Rhmol06G0046500 [Rhododendron molle]
MVMNLSLTYMRILAFPRTSCLGTQENLKPINSTGCETKVVMEIECFGSILSSSMQV